jgi:4-hydroxythreonine-4-phosphate dehydrogenase
LSDVRASGSPNSDPKHTSASGESSTVDPHAPIVLTCGEPAGIGPEIAAAAWNLLGARLPFVYLGDPAHLPPGTPISHIHDPAEAAHVSATALPVLLHPFPGAATSGRPNPEYAAAVIRVIARGVELVTSGSCSALVTAPIHKKALKDGAGFAHPGHTEYLAALAGVPRVVMMLACDALRVVPATIHIPISQVPATLDRRLLLETIRIANGALVSDFGIETPRIAVTGLNPHAGEGGVMGREEIETIIPAIDTLRDEGLAITGPLPADTMFHEAARARYDAAVAMYHDQALIPIKTIDFAGGVNVTLGLPFVRTSPDHGTALDIAGQGRADPTSLVAALRLAGMLARNRAAAKARVP